MIYWIFLEHYQRKKGLNLSLWNLSNIWWGDSCFCRYWHLALFFSVLFFSWASTRFGRHHSKWTNMVLIQLLYVRVPLLFYSWQREDRKYYKVTWKDHVQVLPGIMWTPASWSLQISVIVFSLSSCGSWERGIYIFETEGLKPNYVFSLFLINPNYV